jgi:hypothetical protein
MAPADVSLFAGSANKLKREQKERIEKARQKAEKEKLAQQRVREKREAMEREQQNRRMAELAAIEAVWLSNTKKISPTKARVGHNLDFALFSDLLERLQLNS